MGKGGKNTRDVYDFLYSLDWGVCFGPLDSVNQVWVKDKPIWCGSVQDRTDVIVNRPDLFGGDDAEGGVKGVVEVYMGTDEQFSSEALAARENLTPTTFPGYRGIAHLFFRGAGGGSSSVGSFGSSLPVFPVINPITGLLTQEGSANDTGNGFKWSSNNPYLPAAKVHVTRLPSALSDEFRAIYPFSHYDEITGEPVPHPNFLFPDPIFSYEHENPSSAPGSITVEIENYMRNDDGGFTIVAIQTGSTSTTNHYDASLQMTPNLTFFYDDGSSSPVALGSGTTLESSSGSTRFLSKQYIANGGANVTSFRFSPTFVAIVGNSWNTREFSFTVFPTGSDGGGGSGGNSKTIHCDLDKTGLRMMPNANPAHIIYECMTNSEWGKGESPDNMNLLSFLAAAETLHSELFGLFMIWARQTEIKKFVQEVLDHIKAVLFIDPTSGQWTLKLLRDDYDPDTLPVLDPSNCTVSSMKRRVWGETINEIVVQWTDPLTEEDATLSSHNLANIAIQNTLISETRPYYGIRDPWLAQRVADRDVHEAGAALVSATIETDRSQWQVTPGAVVKLVWPRDGIENMIMRVMKVDYGDPSDRTIRLDVIEDIFSQDQTEFGDIQNFALVSDRQDPAPFTSELAMTAPLPILLRNGATVAELEESFPVVVVGFLGWHDTIKVIDFDVHSEVIKPNGGTAVERIATSPVSRSVLLSTALVAEAQSTLPEALVSRIFLGAEDPGDLLLIGVSEALHEIVMLDSQDAVTGDWAVLRGMYDTVPLPWVEGSRIWQMPETQSRLDPTERVAGEAITYKFLPRTTERRLNIADGVEISFTPSERPHLPFRPANAQLNGQGFGGVTPDTTGFPTITATWSNRNRQLEDQVAQSWSDASVSPETGQTTVLVIEDAMGVSQNEVLGLTGESYELAEADFAGVRLGSVAFYSERDGMRSLTAARRGFDLRTGGYGKAYGKYYGTL